MIAPFEYTAIPFAVIWAIVIWDDWPDGLSWLGMGLILCGVFIPSGVSGHARSR